MPHGFHRETGGLADAILIIDDQDAHRSGVYTVTTSRNARQKHAPKTAKAGSQKATPPGPASTNNPGSNNLREVEKLGEEKNGAAGC
jgi:hypothetical protein